MRLTNPYALHRRVIDLDTNKVVPAVLWVDVEEGLLEAYQTDSFGRVRTTAAGRLTYTAKGRFKVVPLTQMPSARQHKHLPAVARPTTRTSRMPAIGAPHCARCNSPLTLPDSDLCAVCNAADKGYRNRMRVTKVVNPLKLFKCCECSRPAEYAVGDEVEVTPQLQGRTFYARGATVGRRHYCSWHYKPPRLLDPRGEVMEEFEDAHGVRPQWQS